MAAVADQAAGLVGQVVLGPEQLGGLVAGVVHDRLLEGHDIGPQPPQPFLEGLAPGRPVGVAAEQVQ